jgi:hypothetical protein
LCDHPGRRGTKWWAGGLGQADARRLRLFLE